MGKAKIGGQIYNIQGKVANNDAAWGPWTNTTEALTKLAAMNQVVEGKTVGIKQTNGGIVEYWLQPGTNGLALVEKGAQTGASGTVYTKSETNTLLAEKLTSLTSNLRGVFHKAADAADLQDELEEAFEAGDTTVNGSQILIIDPEVATSGDSMKVLTFDEDEDGYWKSEVLAMNIRPVTITPTYTAADGGDQIATFMFNGVQYNLYAPPTNVVGAISLDTSFDSNPQNTRVPSTKLVKDQLDLKATKTEVTQLSSQLSELQTEIDGGEVITGKTTLTPIAYIDNARLLYPSSDGKLKMATSSSMCIAIYQITKDKIYEVKNAKSSNSTGFWGYCNSYPAAVTETIEVVGKYAGENPTQYQDAEVLTRNVVAENYSYLAITSGRSAITAGRAGVSLCITTPVGKITDRVTTLESTVSEIPTLQTAVASKLSKSEFSTAMYQIGDPISYESKRKATIEQDFSVVDRDSTYRWIRIYNVEGYSRLNISLYYPDSTRGYCFYTSETPSSATAISSSADSYHNSSGTYSGLDIDVPSDAKILILGGSSNDANSQVKTYQFSIDAINAKVAACQSALAESAVPSYYGSHLSDKVSKYLDCILNGGARNDGFLFVTDEHIVNNSMVSPILIRKVLESSPINKVFNGGDIGSNYDSAASVEATKAAIKADWSAFVKTFYKAVTPYAMMLDAKGNHDFNNMQKGHYPFTKGVIRNMVMAHNSRFFETNGNDDDCCYGVYANHMSRVLYVIPDTGRTDGILTTQLNWILSKMQERKNGWSFVIVTHVGSNTITDSVGGMGVESTTAKWRNALHQIQTNGSITLSDGVTQFDFSDWTSKIVLYINGHIHCDNQTNIDGIWHVSSQADSRQTASKGYLCSSIPARTNGTITEQAFDLVNVDFSNGIINCIRIGSGYDRKYHSTRQTIAVGGTTTLSPTISNTVTWSIFDAEDATQSSGSWVYTSNVASVNGGVVTGLTSGQCVVCATDASGNKEFWSVVVS